jgi:hypothetical protein
MCSSLIASRIFELVDLNFNNTQLSLDENGNFSITSTKNDFLFNGVPFNSSGNPNALLNSNGVGILTKGAVVVGNDTDTNETSTTNNLIVDDDLNLITINSYTVCNNVIKSTDIQTDTIDSLNTIISEQNTKLSRISEILHNLTGIQV